MPTVFNASNPQLLLDALSGKVTANTMNANQKKRKAEPLPDNGKKLLTKIKAPADWNEMVQAFAAGTLAVFSGPVEFLRSNMCDNKWKEYKLSSFRSAWTACKAEAGANTHGHNNEEEEVEEGACLVVLF